MFGGDMSPAEYHDENFEASLNLVDQQDLTSSGVQVLFLNFSGATIQKGYGQGKSFLLCSSSATIPASGHSIEEQEGIIQRVQQYYDEANSLVNVVGIQPYSGPYTTIHVGGSYRDLGCLGNSVLGIAPFDRGNSNKNDIAFSFTPARYSADTVAQTIAHEAGHSFGLDHISNRKGIMYPTINSQIEGFRSGSLSRGFATQDSAATLRANLGEGVGQSGGLDQVVSSPNSVDTANPAPNFPNLSNTPDLQNIVPNLPSIVGNLPTTGGSLIPGLDMISSIGTLIPSVGNSNIFNPADINNLITGVVPGNVQNMGGLGDILTIVSSVGQAGGINPLNGVFPADINNLITLLDPSTLPIGGINALLGGLGNGQNDLAGVSNLLGGIISTGAAPGAQTLPDFAGLMGISQVTDLSQLLGMMNTQSAVINSNFQGQDATALLSLLKVAYSQQFQALNI